MVAYGSLAAVGLADLTGGLPFYLGHAVTPTVLALRAKSGHRFPRTQGRFGCTLLPRDMRPLFGALNCFHIIG